MKINFICSKIKLLFKMGVRSVVTLNDGNKIPVLGLGTWKSQPGEVSQAVKDAIDIGYRHLDCALAYRNEKEVGEGIKTKIAEGVVKRKDLFVTSKLWNTFHRPDLVLPSLKESLSNLGLDYLDLYLIHCPFGFKEDGELFPMVDGKMQFSDVDYLDTWVEMEKLVKAGLVRSIGVSNFNSKQITRLLSKATIKPVTNQIEVHPYLDQHKISKFCRELGIEITAYSPLGSPDRPWAKPEDTKVLDDSWIANLAKEKRKTSAQLLIRWNLQLGNIVIPKSVTKSRIAENFDVFDFSLSDEEMEAFNKLDENYRICPMDGAAGHKYHPFENDEF